VLQNASRAAGQKELLLVRRLEFLDGKGYDFHVRKCSPVEKVVGEVAFEHASRSARRHGAGNG